MTTVKVRDGPYEKPIRMAPKTGRPSIAAMLEPKPQVENEQVDEDKVRDGKGSIKRRLPNTEIRMEEPDHAQNKVAGATSPHAKRPKHDEPQCEEQGVCS